MRTREKVFAGDDFALKLAKQKAREEFYKNRNVTDEEQIQQVCIDLIFLQIVN